MATKVKKSINKTMLAVLIAAILLAIGGIGYSLTRTNEPSNNNFPTQPVPSSNEQSPKTDDQVTTPGEATDTQQCLEDWYKKHPETRPENRKPGMVYLEPPCPGVPQ